MLVNPKVQAYILEFKENLVKLGVEAHIQELQNKTPTLKPVAC
jgi:hypothetical protein